VRHDRRALAPPQCLLEPLAPVNPLQLPRDVIIVDRSVVEVAAESARYLLVQVRVLVEDSIARRRRPRDADLFSRECLGTQPEVQVGVFGVTVNVAHDDGARPPAADDLQDEPFEITV
jgi:hypothetical protein